MDLELRGKVVLVTGAGQGLGEAIAIKDPTSGVFRPQSSSNRRCPANSSTIGWCNRRPWGVSMIRWPCAPVTPRTDCTHSTTGSTLSTMPGPPPKGRSSTVRCLSLAQLRMSCR
jgi:hypothetical protein